jgi:hypothetical protein
MKVVVTLCSRLMFFGVLTTLIVGCGGREDTGPQPDANTVELIRTSLSAGAPAETVDAATVEPTGFATLKGTFRFQGQAPNPTPLSITKDEAVCAPGGKSVYDRNFVVDSATGGLANVLLYVDKIPAEWVNADAQAGHEGEVVFDQKDCVFLTRLVAMQTSQSLRILNSDPVGHNLMVAEFNETIPSGGSSTYRPRKEQRSPVEMRCAVHPWMKAWFINRDNPYFAVTGPDGSFQIPNLPAGVELEFRVWQEKIGPITQVSLNGQSTSWSKGKMTVMLEPESELEMDVVLSDALLQ